MEYQGREIVTALNKTLRICRAYDQDLKALGYYPKSHAKGDPDETVLGDCVDRVYQAVRKGYGVTDDLSQLLRDNYYHPDLLTSSHPVYALEGAAYGKLPAPDHNTGHVQPAGQICNCTTDSGE